MTTVPTGEVPTSVGGILPLTSKLESNERDWAASLAELIKLLLEGDIHAVAYDLWRTLGRGPYPEPIEDLQKMLGLVGRVECTEFLVTCLTTPHKDPGKYLAAIAAKYDVPVPDGVEETFAELIESEIDGVWIYDDVAEHLRFVKSLGYKIALVTNSWPFPVGPMLTRFKLDKLFDVVVSSSDEAIQTAKQQGPSIYEKTAQLLGLHPSKVLMIGDNHKLDVEAARQCGMNAGLIDRDIRFHDERGRCTCNHVRAANMPAIQTLRQLQEAIVASRRSAA